MTRTRTIGRYPAWTLAGRYDGADEFGSLDESPRQTTTSETASGENTIDSVTHPRILVPFDGSPQAARALEQALVQFDAEELFILYVVDVSHEHDLFVGLYTERITDTSDETADMDDERLLERALNRTDENDVTVEERIERLFDEAQKRADEYGVTLTKATELGRPARRIVAFATENDVDLIVMGTAGRTGLKRFFSPSVAPKVVRSASVPVLTVRERDRSPPSQEVH